MVDSLRDRIAAAITGIRIQRDGDAYAMAGAVLAELAVILKPRLDAYDEARTMDSQVGEAMNSSNVEGDELWHFIANITDWKADDE